MRGQSPVHAPLRAPSNVMLDALDQFERMRHALACFLFEGSKSVGRSLKSMARLLQPVARLLFQVAALLREPLGERAPGRHRCASAARFAAGVPFQAAQQIVIRQEDAVLVCSDAAGLGVEDLGPRVLVQDSADDDTQRAQTAGKH